MTDRTGAGTPVPGPGAFGTGLDGSVVDFDPEVGLGTVAADDGRRWLFHCTAIAGGGRRIDTGTRVRFDVGPAGPGRWEAKQITPQG